MSIYKHTFFIFALLISVFGIAIPTLAQGPTAAQGEHEFVAGEILVKFKPDVSLQDTGQKVAKVSGLVVQVVPAIGTLRVKVPEGQEQAAIDKLKDNPDVEYVELNHMVYALGTPNDPFYSSSQWGMPKINLPTAWDITEGDSSVIVAVLDTGIDLDHPDFSCTVPGGANKLTSGWDYAYNDGNPDDDHGHGSHAAGIVGACTNNSIGVAGTAPNTRLMPVQVLNSSGDGSYADVASGVTYAVNNGAKIINLSLGGSSNNSTMANAIQYAYDNGVLIVAASGNSGTQSILYPAAYNTVMAVGSTTSSDARSWFSNYGSNLDVVAPGSSIYSTVLNSYGYKSGTSMATPYTAGLAALIWSVAPDLTHNEVRQIIQSTAKDLGDPGQDIYFGYGRIDAQNALETLLSSLELQDISGQTLVSPINFLADDQPGFLPSEKMLQVATLSPNAITWTVTISPNVSWLSISPPSAGLVSASVSDNFTLVATRPVTYGTYTTILIVSGTTSGGQTVGPLNNEVNINYISELQRIRLPIVFGN